MYSDPAVPDPSSNDPYEAERITRELRFYRFINRWLPGSYSLKFLVIAFVGTHVPLIAFVAYLTVMHGWRQFWLELVVVLVATLLGTAFTLLWQFQLLAPVRVSTRAFTAYRTRRPQLALPRAFQDEAGQLMGQSAECIEELTRLLKLKDNLAAGIAHDFRSPLTSIVVAADLAIDDSPGQPALHAMLHVIRSSALAQARQVEGLLDAVLDDTRNASFDFRPVDVARLWTATFDTLRLSAAQRRVTLNFQPSPARVGGDEARLVQVLNNLVSNAIKASAAGSVITITAEARKKICVIHVRDFGSGIDVDQLRTALAAGDDVKRLVRPNAPSLGLGLRMVQSLLRLHASRLSFALRPEGGSDFWFELTTVN